MALCSKSPPPPFSHSGCIHFNVRSVFIGLHFGCDPTKVHLPTVLHLLLWQSLLVISLDWNRPCFWRDNQFPDCWQIWWEFKIYTKIFHWDKGFVVGNHQFFAQKNVFLYHVPRRCEKKGYVIDGFFTKIDSCALTCLA